jgi:hypothetical protein
MSSADAPQAQPPQEISCSSTASGFPKRMIAIAAAAAAVIVLATGLGYLLVRGGGWTASSPDV